MTFSEIAVGMEERFSVRVDAGRLDLFRQLTGDGNSLHTEQNIAYGMMSSSFLSPFAGVYFLGENAVLMSVELEFPNRLQLAEDKETTLHYKAMVTEKNETFGFIVLKLSGVSEDGIKFLRGKMRVGVRRD